jgi:hypothetical protein
VIEQIGTSAKKTRNRGMAKASLELIEAMRSFAEAAQPITGRGIGYKLFSRGLIPSMKTKEMHRVYRLLKEARERDMIPWEWIVDETRHLEKVRTWADPDAYMYSIERRYRLEFWDQQPLRCMVVSEKGTVRGVLAPVLHKYGVGFQVMHGFTSTTCARDLAQDNDGRDLIVLYVGDYDPSGMFMSEDDLPSRLNEYGGDHIEVRRLAITREQAGELLSFPAADKIKDPRYKWFVPRYGDRCGELDAMDPNDLRDCVEAAIKELIEPEAWERCETVNAAQVTSIDGFIRTWKRWDQPNWIDEFMPAPAVTTTSGPEAVE